MTRPEDTLPNGSDSSELLEPLDAAPGPARPLSEAEASALVELVHARVSALPRQRRRFPPLRALGVAGALAAASAAAAAVLTLSRPEPAPPPQNTPREQRPRVTPPLEVPQPEVAPPIDSLDEPAPPPDSADHAQDERRPRRAPKPQKHSEAAADRLAEANALRGQRRYREALDLYSEVIERYPGSIQSSAARVAAAAIRLEQFGDVQGAERLYREAKTSGGQLTAEAQFGLAEVARARGDASAESSALEEFLRLYPGNPLGAAARRRLDALVDGRAVPGATEQP